jgi:hypothetical protein
VYQIPPRSTDCEEQLDLYGELIVDGTRWFALDAGPYTKQYAGFRRTELHFAKRSEFTGLHGRSLPLA